MRVMKFGGTSVGAPERLQQVLGIIVRERTRGPLTVVVSAMGDTTDWLLEAIRKASEGDTEGASRVVDRIESLALKVGGSVLPGTQVAELVSTVRETLGPLRQLLVGVALVRERTRQMEDLTMSFGERLSAQIVAAALSARDTPAVYVDARDWTVTDATFGLAVVDVAASKTKLLELQREWGERVPVVTGFIGRTRDGRTTTLGRNGSDYTAALLAQGLAASEVNVWTDVPGVMTADPSIVADAYPVKHLSQQEALELANLGLRMFHPRTMFPLVEAGIPLRIRHTMHPDAPGTVVDARGVDDVRRPSCVVSLEDLALIDVEYNPTSTRAPSSDRLLRVLEAAGVTVWTATFAPRGRALAIVVPSAQKELALATIERELAAELSHGEVDRPRARTPVTLLTLVAEAMGRTPNVAGRFFGALGQVGIHVRAIAQGASSRSISCVIDAADTAVGVRTVHAAFNLAAQQVNVFLLGKGVVGGAFLEQVRSQAQKLAETHEVALRVVGVADRTQVLFDERGLELEQWQTLLAQSEGKKSLDLLGVLDRLSRLPVPILVDCTAGDGMERVYREAFTRRVHVVAANKKPLTVPWAVRSLLMEAARSSHRAYLYETTVGASLPVIDTLNNLLRTGDSVHLIEGALSGTLGYLCNELMRGTPLSVAVRTARERGYTEPHPRDDLSGLDVARKGLILARELGAELELEQVEVEPLVPASLLEHADLDAFFKALEGHDAHASAMIERLRSQGKVLRYLARIEPGRGAKGAHVRVGPVEIDAEHPATRLRGAEAFVAFTTERYREYPLVVQGAGAGGAVTAAGVLTDVLRVAQTLRGR